MEPSGADLAAFLADPSDARFLRELAAHLGGPSQRQDHEVVGILRRGLANGRLAFFRRSPELRPLHAPSAPAAAPDDAPPPAETDVAPVVDHWIEVQLVDEDDVGISGQRCLITTADGSVHSRYTDSLGCVRLDTIVDGECDVSFPDLDGSAWTSAGPVR